MACPLKYQQPKNQMRRSELLTLMAISKLPAAGPQDVQPVMVPNQSCAASSQPTVDSPVAQSFQAVNMSRNSVPDVSELPGGAQISAVESVKVTVSHSADSAVIHHVSTNITHA